MNWSLPMHPWEASGKCWSTETEARRKAVYRCLEPYWLLTVPCRQKVTVSKWCESQAMTHTRPTERERGGGTGDTPTERENWPHEAFKLIFFVLSAFSTCLTCKVKVTGYSLLVTFNCTCAWTILYGLWTDAISAIKYLFFFFEPKITFSVYGSEET